MTKKSVPTTYGLIIGKLVGTSYKFMLQKHQHTTLVVYLINSSDPISSQSLLTLNFKKALFSFELGKWQFTLVIDTRLRCVFVYKAIVSHICLPVPTWEARMKTLFYLIVLFAVLKWSSCQSDGLFLTPEMLKTGIEVVAGNDYMDFNPGYTGRIKTFEVIDIPANNLEIIIAEDV